MQWTRPKSVRQIGEIPGRGRIYMEDYVIRFVKRLAEQSHGMEKAAVLLGTSLICDGEKIYQISGVVEIHNFAGRSGPKLTDEDWDYIYSEMKENFTDLEIVGWFYSCQGFSVNQAGQLLQMHKLNFEKRDKVLYLYDETDGEDSFFLYRSGQLEKQKGYYIYYEKNSQMQTYMIERSQREGGKASEKVEDKAVRNFRKIIDSKKPEEREEKTSVFSYAATVCLALAVLVAGVNLYRNQQGKKGVPEDYRATSASVVQITPVITEGTAARETQTPTPSVKAESRERITVTPAADPKKKETDSPENNVVETTVTEIPPGSADTEQAKKQKKKESSEEKNALADSTEKKSTEETSATAENVQKTYVIRPGDTLYQISLNRYGTVEAMEQICALNGISANEIIYPGQVIVLP